MKKGKLLLATGALLLSVSALVACSQGGKSSSSDNQVFSYVYTQDPDTLDYSSLIRSRPQNLQVMLWMAC